MLHEERSDVLPSGYGKLRAVDIVSASMKLAAVLAAFLFVQPADSIAHTKAATSARIAQQACLASAVHHEARGEPVKAQRAVVDVIVHRATAKRKTFCEIVKEPAQFSWYRSKGLKRYDKAQEALLLEALQHKRQLPDSFMWFYSGHPPAWSAKMRCKPIGRLTFCKERK